MLDGSGSDDDDDNDEVDENDGSYSFEDGMDDGAGVVKLPSQAFPDSMCSLDSPTSNGVSDEDEDDNDTFDSIDGSGQRKRSRLSSSSMSSSSALDGRDGSGSSLRVLRLVGCPRVTDAAAVVSKFLNLHPLPKHFPSSLPPSPSFDALALAIRAGSCLEELDLSGTAVSCVAALATCLLGPLRILAREKKDTE